MPRQPLVSLFALLLFAALSLTAQQTPSDVTPGAIHTAPRAEPAVESLTRKDQNTLVLDLGRGKHLSLHDFDFNGDPVQTAKLHLKQLAPGVYEVSSVAYEVGYWHFSVTDNAAFYGMGERFDVLDHAHTIVHNLSIDNGDNKGSGTYKPIPFFMSTTGYGLWLDTTGDATFDFGATEHEQVIVDAPADHLRVLLFTGAAETPGRFPDILAAFTARIAPGKPRSVLPPYWVFAPWQSRDFHSSEREVFEDVDRTRELGLPASVIVLDSPWSTAYNSYLFNPKQFDDAPGMIKHLHESGYKLVLWHTPWINNKSDPPGEPGFAGKLEELSPNYAEAAERGYFVKNQDGSAYLGRWWKGQGSLIDFTNPKAKQWWQDQLRLAIHAGADGFKNDDAEGSFITPEVRFADGTDPRMMRNQYGTLYNNAVEELIDKDLKGDGVIFGRSVTTGANGLGMLWAGDNDASFSPENGLSSVITAGLSAGLSGIPLWAADLGGYRSQPDTPNPTLLERWTEFAAFSPVMQIHSQANITPWTFDRASGGTAALDIYRRYAVLHTSLLPYLYAAVQQAQSAGTPILRALVLDYQDDPRARAIKDEYLFGPSLLVAPVIDENISRVVYLPAGEWLNLFTGEAVTGPKTFLAKAPLDTIPVFARRGTVLPKIPEDVMTLVPVSESGNTKVHALDERRVFEVLGPADHDSTFIDFEGRSVTRSGSTLKISAASMWKSDKSARVILRWRFTTPHNVTVDGVNAVLKQGPDGATSTEFDQTGDAVIAWQ